MPASIGDWNRWANHAEVQPDRRIRLQIAMARTSAGNGSLEERLLRLMVWVGTEIAHPLSHPGSLCPREILEQRAGWCEQQCLLFAFLAYHIFRVECRGIELLHSDGTSGHSVVEVVGPQDLVARPFLLDVEKEHQSVYRGADGRLLGYDDILLDPAVIVRDGHWWRGTNGVGKDGFYTHGESKATFHGLATPEVRVWPWGTKP